MKLLIGYPPLPCEKGVPLLSQNRQFQWFNRPTFIYPVVPACAATMARDDGHDVCWLDGIAERLSPAEFDARLDAFDPDVVVYETKTPVVRRHWELVKALKARRPSTAVVLVGDHVTALPAETMDACPVDYILTGGDWDFLLRNLLRHLRDGAALEPGIWRRDAAGAAIDGGKFLLDHDLNSLPRIDRELTKWRNYSVNNGNFRRTPGTYVMAGRDCWHGRCTFCSWAALYPKYRTRKPENVVDEIQELVERYGVREIMDDTGCFPVGQWLRDFCRLMVERKLNKRVTIDCNMRFGALAAEDYRMMKRAGFRFVLFGLESANQSTLDKLDKNLKVEQIAKGAREASAAGLDVHVTVMLGFPWEGEEEIKRTVALARDLLVHGHAYTLQVTQTVPYPGTPLFRQCEENGWLTTHSWDDFDMRGAVMTTPVGEERIKCAIRDIYRAFFHPISLWNRLIHTRHPIDDAKFYIRGLLSLVGHLRDFKG